MPLNKRARKKRMVIFASFAMCCLGASLLCASFATEYWYKSGVKTDSDSTTSYGTVYFGLFSGKRETYRFYQLEHTLKVVCLDGVCMYSCASTKEQREYQLRQVLNNELNGTSICVNEAGSSSAAKVDFQSPKLQRFWSPSSLASKFLGLKWTGPLRGTHETEEDRVDDQESKSEAEEYMNVGDGVNEDETDPIDPTLPSVVPDDLMDYGLWVGTIVCLSLGLLMAVVGALFAVINTATTPVEAITGVPGLYLWNGLAALFDMICVILWAVQFHTHLSKNVLLYDRDNGWTTEGLEVFGYSFWLVVVAIFVHVANIAIIFIGTYEPKVKEQMEPPESKSGNIMLY